ncbi:hypothetical protein KUTeg_004176 [Tegillarca granosa]|uniref:Uncharacterized protein n=1 Tax=Tegillarca granosa TaxID=220873 RepID=A0ABQ9FPA3_TEGGR|nr:hypothetical protein KUTeg_004176 [Tegillarca granosa]
MCIGHGGYLAKVDDHLINHELGEYARGKGAQMFWIGSFFCHNGNCINSNHMCDNYDDCGDYSDEINCEPNCRRKIQMSSGTISSPSSGGNGFYDSSKVCVWTIIGPEGSNIFINFTRFSTEYRRDMVNILIGGETEATSTSIAQLSGQPDLNTLHFRSYNNFMIVTFSTDSSVTKPGFSANFHSFDEGYPPVNNLKATNSPQEFLPQFYYLSSQSVYLGGKDYVWVITATEERKLVTIENDNFVIVGCDISISSDVGEIFSPGYLYGINYANYANCSWAVINAGQKKATLFFNNDMDFEANVDYLKIYKDSVDTSGTAVHTGKGFTPITLRAAGDITSDNGTFYLRFETNSIVNKKGFYAVYSVDCPDPGFNANTLVTRPKTWRYKDKITVSCSTGYTFSIYQFSQQSLTMECLFGAVYCGLPPVINNAFPNSNGLTLTYNNYVTYQCFPGYTMTGNANITCQSSRTWTSPPSCSSNLCELFKVASCSMPPNIANGQRTLVEGNGMDYSSVVSYKCNAGYHLIGAPRAICQSDGQYSNPTPTCQNIKECLTNNGKGECHQKCTDIADGYTCSCDQDGFVLYDKNGTSNLYLSIYETGLKDGDVLRYNHTCVRNICPDSFVKDYQNTVQLTRKQTFYTEDILHYMCRLGYKSSDRLLSMCSSAGSWAYLLLLVISCGDPGMEPGANYTRPSSFVFDSQFQFSCSNLYRLEGNSSKGDQTVQCEADGNWDFGTLQCVGKL